jgi:polysaccharide export outer membrane protein
MGGKKIKEFVMKAIISRNSKYAVVVSAFSLLMSYSAAAQGPNGAKLQNAANVAASSTTDTVATAPAPAKRGSVVAPGFVIGPADVLAISVWKEPEISRTVPVRLDGKITLPLAGDLTASGLTTEELQAEIRNKLTPYLTNPEVTVIVQEAKSKKVNIVGKVSKPGAYDLAKPTTVLDAIAMAGGLGDFAKESKIYVLRTDTNGQPQRLHFNYKQVLKGKNPGQNIELQAHDTIVVP